MSDKYLNIYNNLINLTRNKLLYKNLNSEETFSIRLTFYLIHFAFFLKIYKSEEKKLLQKIPNLNVSPLFQMRVQTKRFKPRFFISGAHTLLVVSICFIISFISNSVTKAIVV